MIFFVYIVKAHVELTHNAQQGGHETRGPGVGRTKQWETETPGDLWKGEGWGGEHGVYKMDIQGLSGRKAGNLKDVGLGWINGGRKDRGFGWGKIRGDGELLFRRPGGKNGIEESVGVYSKGGKKEE